MNQKLSTNSYVTFIGGYLDSLADIDGSQREFYLSFNMIKSKNISIDSKFKIAFSFMEDIEILKQIEYKDECCFTHFLEKLLLIKPFKGLYELSDDVQISNDVVKTYRDYIIFHLEDYLDFALEEEENKLSLNTTTMNLLLLKYKNNRDDSISYFISIQRDVKDITQFINFYRDGYAKKDFSTFFNEIVEWKEKRNLD